MAFPDRPTDNITWAEDAAALVNEPVGERARGWPFSYIPPADQKNWLQRAVGRWLDYFSRSAGGGFSSLPALIDRLEPGESAPLITPDIQTGREIDRIESADEILAIAVDGARVYWVDASVSIRGYDLRTEQMLGPIAVGSIDVTSPIYLEANGDSVLFVAQNTDTPTGAALLCLEADFSATRWFEGIALTGSISVEGVALAGSSAYVTLNEAGEDPKTSRFRLTDGVEIASHQAANTFVRATNGRFVAFAVGAGTVSIRSPDLATEYWSHAHGATGAIANMAADGSTLYVLTGDNDLHAYPLQEFGNFSGVIATPDWGGIRIDTEEVLTNANATSGVTGIKKDGRPVGTPWQAYAADIDLTKEIIDFGADDRAVYIAAETTTAGAYAIWIIAKGQAPKIWRRLDPTDDDSWPRTLAAPI